MSSTTLTVHLSSETEQQLGRLALSTRRSNSALAAEAIAHYIERELSIVDGIERARAELRAGHGIPHEQVMREAQTIIEDARAKR